MLRNKTRQNNKYLDCGEARSAFIVSASVGAVEDALLAGLQK